MLSCREVSSAIASDELETAGWPRRFSVRLHLLLCRHCRRYSRQMRAIGIAARRVLGSSGGESSSNRRLRGSILDGIPRGEEDGSDPRV